MSNLSAYTLDKMHFLSKSFLFVLRRCRNITYPLNLPQVSIVFIFVNEALSVILRSIHSAINRTPTHLLKEIILVDDNSNNSKEHHLVTQQWPNHSVTSKTGTAVLSSLGFLYTLNSCACSRGPGNTLY